MTVSATTVTQYYTGIFRQAPTAAVQAGYQAMATDAAALNSMLSAANIQVDPVVRLYQTAFNRLPDTAGMTAWVVPFSTNAISLQAIANGFTQSTEFTTLYPSTMSNAQFVGALYWNILQRAGEDAGIRGWTNALNSGALTRAQVLLGFSDSAEFVAKVEPNVNSFLTKIANTPVADQGAASLYSGSLFDQGGSSIATNWALTTNIDNFVGNPGNNTFVGGTAQIQAADQITGGSGTNVAKLYLDGAAASSLNATNVQTFLISSSFAGGTTFTATNVSGTTEFWSKGSTTALTVANIQGNATLGLDQSNVGLVASYKASVITASDTLKLATITSGTKAAPVNISVNDGGATSKFLTLDVTAASGKSYITIDDSADGAAVSTTDFTAIKTSGAGFVSISDLSTTAAVEPFANVKTVSMNATTGSTVDLARSGNAENVTVTGAGGDDTIIFAAGAFNTSDTVDMGAGTNTLVLGDADLAQSATADLSKAINATKGVTVLATSAAADVKISAGRYSAIDQFATTAAVAGTGGTAGKDSTAAAGGAATAGLAAISVTNIAPSGDSLNIQGNATGGAGAAGGKSTAASKDGGAAAAGQAGISLRMATDGGTDTFTLSVTENDSTVLGGAGAAGGAAGKGGTAGAAGAAGVGIDAREIETLNINLTKSLTVDAGATNGGTAATVDTLVGGNATINIAGTGNADLGRTAANSADAAFQNLNIKAADLVGKLTIVLSSGNDTVVVGSKGSDVTAGTGLDTITLGNGVDIVRFAAGDSGVISSGTVGKIDTVNKFTAGIGGDVIDNTGAASGFTVLTTAQQNTITTQANLTDAITTALGYIATGNWGAFTYADKTYAVFDGDGNATYDNAADIAVYLAGVTATSLTSANFS